MMLHAIARRFERWIDPYARRSNLRPPRETYAFVWFYVRQAKGPFFVMLVFGGLVAMMEAGLFWFVGKLVDMLNSVPKDAGWEGLIAAHGGLLLGMLLTVVVLRFLIVSGAALMEEQTVVPGFFTLVRWQAYAHVVRQSIGFFQNDFAGRIVTKVWSAGQSTGDFVVSLLQGAWFMTIYMISTIALIASLDGRLAVVVVLWIAGFACIARFFVPRVRRLARETAEASSLLNGRMVDTYSNIQTLKLFGGEDENDRYMREGFDAFQVTLIAFTRHITAVRASLALLAGLMIATIAAMSIDLWFAGDMTSGGVAVTLGLVLRMNMLLGRMMTQFNAMMRNIGTIQNAADMISQPIRLVDRADAKPLVIDRAEIRFENVEFRYGEGANVIDRLSLTVRPGERVGIVGRSGAGKSTLVSLLLRFHDIDSGRILVSGQDIAAVTQESLRRQIGMVAQDTSLLHRSVRDNILFGRPDATDAMLAAAAERAEALEFIPTLQDQRRRTGFDAHVGERGVKLSGGQRQRIAIARVMLKDAPILVLDEATSALDSEVEAAIQSNLDRLMQGKTVLAIAHRLSTIAALDRLVVMDKGRVIEEGTHAALVEKGGLYAELWARQSGGFIAVDEG